MSYGLEFRLGPPQCSRTNKTRPVLRGRPVGFAIQLPASRWQPSSGIGSGPPGFSVRPVPGPLVNRDPAVTNRNGAGSRALHAAAKAYALTVTLAVDNRLHISWFRQAHQPEVILVD